MTASAFISLLIHGILLAALQLYLAFQHQQQPQTPPFGPLQVSLIPRQKVLPPIKPEKKLLTIQKPSPVLASEPVNDKPEPAAVPPDQATDPNNDKEPITGIAFPGPAPTPFSNLTVEGDAFFSQHHAEMQARDRQQQLQPRNSDRPQQEIEAQIKLRQLESLLHQFAASHPGIAGHCIYAAAQGTAEQTLRCDTPELKEVILPYQHQIEQLMHATQNTSVHKREFFFTSNRNKLIILN